MDRSELTADLAITIGLVGGLKNAGYNEAQIVGFLEGLAAQGENKVAFDMSDVGGYVDKGITAVKDSGIPQGIGRALTMENLKKYAPYAVAGLGAVTAREVIAPKRKMFGVRGLLAGALGGAAGGYLYNNWDTAVPRINKAVDVAQAAMAGTTESGNAAR